MKYLIGLIIVFYSCASVHADPECSDPNLGDNSKIMCERYFLSAAHSSLIGHYLETMQKIENCNEKNEWQEVYKTYHSSWVPYMIASCRMFCIDDVCGDISVHDDVCIISQLKDFDKKIIAELKEGIKFGRCAASPQSNFSPSFSCSSALNDAERMICGDFYLSLADRRLNDFYTKAKENKVDNAGLIQEQRVWLKKRNQCKDTACLIYSYFHRINDFKADKDTLFY